MLRPVADAGQRPAVAVRRARFVMGARLSVPGMVGTFVWGIIAGVAMIQAGMSVGQSVGMTLIVFSGTAQLAALPLMASGASFALIGFTTFLTSLRFMIYSASLSRDLSRLPPGLRSFAGYMTTDSGLAVYQTLSGRERRAQRTALFMGLNLPVWAAWQVGSLLGIAVMAYVEPGRDLGFLGTLAVLALIAQAMRVSLAWPVVIAATVVALIGVGWPHRAGMLLAVLVGVVTPLILEARARSSRSAP